MRSVYEMDASVRDEAQRLAIIQGVVGTIGAWMVGGWFLNYFAMELGAKGAAMGIILATGNIASILRVFAPAFVNRSDNRKGVWIKANIISRLWSIGLPLLAFPQLRPPGIDPLALLVIILCGTTLANAIGDVAWLSWYADIVPESTWGRYFARRNFYLAIPIGIVPLVGGWAMDAYTVAHPDQKLTSYAVVYALGIGFNILQMLPLLKVPNLPLRERPYQAPILSEIWKPFRDPNFRRYALFHCWLMLGSGIPQASFQLYLKNYLGLGLVWPGAFQLVNQVFSMWGFRLAGPLTDRFGNKPIIILGLIGAATGPFFWLPTERSNFYWIFAAYVVWGFGWAGVNLGRQNLMLRVAPLENNVAYIAAAEGLGGVCLALFQIIGGFWLESLIKADWTFHMAGVDWNPYHLFFLLSFVGRSSAAIWVFGILEPGCTTVKEMLTTLKGERAVRESEVKPT